MKAADRIWFLILISALALTGIGCHTQRFEERTNETFRFDSDDHPVKLRVRNDDGSIEVFGKDGGPIEIDVEILARASSPAMAESLLETMQVEASESSDGTITVTASKQRHLGADFANVRANISVRVPTKSDDADLELYTKNGSVELERVQGRISVETDDGNIELHRASGHLVLRSGDGRIRGQSLEGAIEAETEDGSIRLEGTFSAVIAYSDDGSIHIDCEQSISLTRDWSIRADDGSIRLRLPDGISAELDASTDDGRVTNELSSFRAQQTDEDHLRGVLGGGGKLILLKAHDGSITLSQS